MLKPVKKLTTSTKICYIFTSPQSWANACVKFDGSYKLRCLIDGFMIDKKM